MHERSPLSLRTSSIIWIYTRAHGYRCIWKEEERESRREGRIEWEMSEMTDNSAKGSPEERMSFVDLMVPTSVEERESVWVWYSRVSTNSKQPENASFLRQEKPHFAFVFHFSSCFDQVIRGLFVFNSREGVVFWSLLHFPDVSHRQLISPWQKSEGPCRRLQTSVYPQ
jgi:hypothetical protein